MKAKPALLALVMSAMLGFPASAQVPATGEGVGGIYGGSYLCEDREHGVVLEIAVGEIEERPELRVNGTLGLVPVLAGANGDFADVAGSFTISGFLPTEPRGANTAGHLQFQHEEWLLEPEGYGSANFRGQLNRRDDGLLQITGTPLAVPAS